MLFAICNFPVYFMLWTTWTYLSRKRQTFVWLYVFSCHWAFQSPLDLYVVSLLQFVSFFFFFCLTFFICWNLEYSYLVFLTYIKIKPPQALPLLEIEALLHSIANLAANLCHLLIASYRQLFSRQKLQEFQVRKELSLFWGNSILVKSDDLKMRIRD